MEGFRADLKAHTLVDSSSRIVGSSSCYDSRTAQSLNSATKLPIEFRKEWAATIVTYPVTGAIASSFEHFKISRTYRLKVTLQFRIANKSMKLVKECPVVVTPVPMDLGVQDVKMEEPPPPPIEAGPSGTGEDHEDEELPPPSYEEAGSSKLVKSG